MSKKVKIIIITAIAVVGIGGFIGVKVFNSRNNNKMMEQSMIDLYTIPGKEKIFLSGKIVPSKSEKFSVDGEFGSLDKMNVKDGQAVKKGALLYSMKNTENISQVSDLKTQVANKQNQLKLAEEESKAGINSEITELNSQITSLDKKSYKSVYAPFEGKVYLPESVEGAEGEMGPLMILETTDYYIKTETNEMEIVKLKVKQKIDITVNATKEKAKGEIESIGDRPLEGGSDMNGGYDTGGVSYASFPVKISVKDQKSLKNGFAVQGVAYFGSNENKLPLTSVLEENGKYYVFKIVNDIAKKSEITVKEKTENEYIVTGGLKENDLIPRDVSLPSIVDGQNIYGEGEATK